MRTFVTLWRRDTLALLRSSLAWGMLAVYGAFTGLMLLITLFAAEGTVQTLATVFTRVVVLSLPAFTALASMRSFAEERVNGTLETLLTAPVSDATVVLAKFGASLVLLVLALAVATGGFVFYVESALPPPAYSRTGIAVAMVLLLLHGALWTALGILAALCSRHQTMAAAVGLLFTVPHALIASGILPFVRTSSYLDSLSIGHTARGIIDSRPIVLCLTLLPLVLFVAVRVLESRRWKL